MRIVKTREEFQNEKQRKDKIRSTALSCCNVCPCCGENKSTLYYISQNIYNKGIIESAICKDWYGKKYERDKGILYRLFALEKKRYYQVDCFSCLTCGVEWESEPYTYDT